MRSKNFHLFLTVSGIIMLVAGAYLWGQKSQNPPPVSGEVAAPSAAKDITDSHDLQLQVPLEQTADERQQIMREIAENGTFFLRDIYERHLESVGANGLISAVQTAYPTCHDRGHDLGKVIYDELGDIGEALRTCQDACNSGCMHGVLMEMFTSPDDQRQETEALGFHQHVTIDEVKGKLSSICDDTAVSDQYREGDCLHGVGHALMFLAEYNVPKAIEYCGLFPEEPQRYYCATGAYMEYNNNFGQRDYKEKPLFYPCDENLYPAACFRYKLVAVFALHYAQKQPAQELIEKCMQLDEYHRLGCFHGVGNANMAYIVENILDFDDLCSFGTKNDQYMCIEGAIERMSKYYPDIAPDRCDQFSEKWKKDHCLKGATNGIYSLEKPFDLYL